MEISDASGRLLAGLLETRTGQQLAVSRRWRIETALGGLMRERGMDSVDDLMAAIISSRKPELADRVVEALLNNETFFFRDRGAFDLLLGPALDRLRHARARDRSISIWCAGCSTGQEAYSLAMSFAETKARWEGWRISILATDISHSAIAQAKSGLYSQFEVQRGLPVTQMVRWFEEAGSGNWRISPVLKAAVRFEVHNLTAPAPPPGRFDIILCRNVLLYLTAEWRREVFDRLAQAGGPDTVLLLGAGETVIGQTDQFVSDPECRGLYIRRRMIEPARAVG
ncbi:CheR family methyltransferase [Sphingosinicella rhizophila]|uniref:protein-glutamate O-methyltransferase n=1 Tax=Sphingosinicella rhizophila TaxID=3050082 RepID=A0ABU3Q3L5_9SPHN|nr:protein-glutamate O-methyltransferase CheR [Sphingosinicella sp. GR2756]MDT9597550.1 protein-glutamate O-methyltransferase CheR [Sphingosinicella sp. GR2756]